MADAVIQTPGRGSAPAAVNRGPVATLVYGMLQFGFWLIVGLFGNILVEWLCMGLLWPEQGSTRSQSLLEAEIRILQQDLQASLLTEQPTRFAVSMADQLQALLYQKTGLVKAMVVVRQYQHSVLRQGDNRFTGFIRQSLAAIHDYLLAGMIATQVYALRLSVLFLSIPVFVLAGLVGAIDGIVQRDLNRWRGGRELGQRYHLAKSMVAPGLTLPWILYLAWPTTVHPWLIILPFAVFVGWVVAITAATFKKYF